MLEPKPCEICGKLFQPTRRANTCCPDPKCRKEAERRRSEAYRKAHAPNFPPKICPVCGQEFKPRMGKQSYCSPECFKQVKRSVRYCYVPKPENDPEIQAQKPKPKPKKKGLTLDQCMKIANAAGLSYGQAQARGLFKND